MIKLKNPMKASSFLEDLGIETNEDLSGLSLDSISYGDADSESDMAFIIRKDMLNNSRSAVIVTDEEKLSFVNAYVIKPYDSVIHFMFRTLDYLEKHHHTIPWSEIERLDICRIKKNCISKYASIGQSTTVGLGSYIAANTRIGTGCRIGNNVRISSGVVIGDNVTVEDGCILGSSALFHHIIDGKVKVFDGLGGILIGDDTMVAAGTVIQRGTLQDTVIGKGCLIGVHVVIGHDSVIGDGVTVVAQSGIAGNVNIGSYAQIMGQCGIANFVDIGEHANIMACSLVTKDVMPGSKVFGSPAREIRNYKL